MPRILCNTVNIVRSPQKLEKHTIQKGRGSELERTEKGM